MRRFFSIFHFFTFLFLCLLGLYWAYSLGVGFGYGFDDEANLSLLIKVQDLASALLFIFSGNAGPVGRPLALASFLINAPSWPSDYTDILRVNVLVHLLNTALVIWFALRLQRYLSWRIRRPEYFALLVGMIWAFSPILISTTLLIVQRMTSLSATFCLAGLIAYLVGRQNLAAHRVRSLMLMSGGLGAGTVLSVLCKENGILLPLFALVIEIMLISPYGRGECGRPENIPRWWFFLFLLIPAVFIALYLAYVAWHSGGTFPGRDFTLAERLLTESRILFAYLRQIVFPTRSGTGPYHDDYLISTDLFDPPVTAVALAAWIALIFAIVRLRSGQWRLLSFALAWFLGGHLIESTVVALELYFEHRNYMPSVGVIFGLVAMLFHPRLNVGFRYMALMVLVANQLFVFRETISVWGNPGVTAELWYLDHPGSLRALQTHVAYIHSTATAEQILTLVDSAPPRLANMPEYQIFRFIAYCQLKDGDVVRAVAIRAEESLRSGVPKAPSVNDLLKISDLMKQGKCNGVTEDQYIRLLETVAFSGRANGLTRSLAHEGLGDEYVQQRVIDKAMSHFEAAFTLRPTLQVATKMVAVLNSVAAYDIADKVIQDTREHAPWRPFVRQAWMHSLDRLARIVQENRDRSWGSKEVKGTQ